jgi:3'-phosphoadenosine 5'-phosphosulfate sulfotransferase (PAPS reductase)/FAD synthetase
MKGTYERISGQQLSDRLAKIAAMQRASLPTKLAITDRIISKALDIGTPGILFSGGRDSTVLLHLLLQRAPDCLIVHNDTTLGSPAVLAWVRTFTAGRNYVETTAADPVKMWQTMGYWPLLPKRTFTRWRRMHPELRCSPVQCCYQLKERFSNPVLKVHGVRVTFWGNRAGESNRRQLAFADCGFLFKPKKYPWFQAYPLQHWTDIDVDEYLDEHVPDFPRGVALEAGCRCCCTDIQRWPNNLGRLFNSDRPMFDRIMRAGLAEQIAIVKGIPDWRKTLEREPFKFLRI